MTNGHLDVSNDPQMATTSPLSPHTNTWGRREWRGLRSKGMGMGGGSRLGAWDRRGIWVMVRVRDASRALGKFYIYISFLNYLNFFYRYINLSRTRRPVTEGFGDTIQSSETSAGNLHSIVSDSQGNPVLAYLQRHGTAQGLTTHLINGYSLNTPDVSTTFNAPFTYKLYLKISRF